ncbi:MAG: hypothetical protein Q7K57_40160 [Burkholderiaceae bacterium]|nr:hypothetical protein [Burkholderiaceae bacterium]
MSTTLTVIVMGLIVVGIGAWASLWPAPKYEKDKDGQDTDHPVTLE